MSADSGQQARVTAADADAIGASSSPLALCAGHSYALDVNFGGALVNALVSSSAGRLLTDQRPGAFEAINAAAQALGLLNLYSGDCPNRYITPVVTRVASLVLELPEDASGTLMLKATSASGPFDAFRAATATLPVVPKQQCETPVTNPDVSSAAPAATAAAPELAAAPAPAPAPAPTGSADLTTAAPSSAPTGAAAPGTFVSTPVLPPAALDSSTSSNAAPGSAMRQPRLVGVSPRLGSLAGAKGHRGTGGDAVGVQQQQETNAEPLCFLQEDMTQPLQEQPHQPTPQLHLYVYESEPEVLARHMLLLALLFDAALPVRARAELFLELHGNAVLRQKSADYLTLQPTVDRISSSSSSPCQQQQEHHRQQQHGAMAAFDLSLLRYADRDALLEAFQRYRHKANFDMAKAWDGRCRKWYADRYDFKTNMVDWDYHMRLSPRGTPFLDAAVGSIVHFQHFRHWRLTGLAHELRDSAYTAANSSMLSTAHGRSKEYKDRQLRDVGRSVSAYGFWGDVLNGPYHAFGTLADDPRLFKVTNKQFVHTSVDVAEHNLLGFMQRLHGSCCSSNGSGSSTGITPALPPAATAPGMTADDSAAAAAAGGCSAGQATADAHRANAARGPTSLANLAAAEAATASAGAQRLDQTGQEQVQQKLQQLQVPDTKTDGSADAAQLSAASCHHHQQGKQQQQDAAAADDEPTRLAALEAAIAAASIERFVSSTRIYLLCGDLKRSLTGRPKFAGTFNAATVGHRHVHLLNAESGLAAVLKQPGGVVFVETGQNMVQLNDEQAAAFEQRVAELAAPAGFVRHPAFCGSSKDGKQQPQSCQGEASPAVGSSGAAGAGWRLPPGHMALSVTGHVGNAAA
ncbi:hypothetical protein COO60DRAFT_1672301 [Scenedesmus sp. NREL 46B-D3]|nr:hypothetical protein COO60DRAFT_1672301 [Scenedesmus sp. NREL 46B-D3]